MENIKGGMMILCDRCKCDVMTSNVTRLLEEFESLEVCEKCHDKLAKAIEKVGSEVSVIRKQKRAEAFRQWKKASQS